MRTRTLLALTLALVLIPAGTASAASKTETSSLGDVSAAFSYDYKKTRYGIYDYSNAHVKITRAGVVVLDEAIGKECSYCTPWPASGAQPGVSSVNVVNLDDDGEPEVLVDLYSGGANCCWYTNAYRFDATQNTYLLSVLRPGLSFPYTLKDLDGDGIPEFKSVDYRFAYKYGSNVDTPRPLRIFQWNDGKLLDVTIGYPELARKDENTYYKLYLSLRKHKQVNLRGVLAAYMADSYNARNSKAAWKRVVAAYHSGDLNRKISGDIGPFGAKYLKSLRVFLKKLGYLRTP